MTSVATIKITTIPTNFSYSKFNIFENFNIQCIQNMNHEQTLPPLTTQTDLVKRITYTVLSQTYQTSCVSSLNLIKGPTIQRPGGLNLKQMCIWSERMLIFRFQIQIFSLN